MQWDLPTFFPFLPMGKGGIKSCILSFSGLAMADLTNLENKEEIKAVESLDGLLEAIYSDFPTSELIGWALATDIPD